MWYTRSPKAVSDLLSHNMPLKTPLSFVEKSLSGVPLSDTEAMSVLTDTQWDAMDILYAAYQVRKAHWGKSVAIHIINNAQNGYCPEDCKYCVQAKTSTADIEAYTIKEESEIMAEAKAAYESGAHRYCMVFSGRGPSKKRVDTLANYIRKIKEAYPIEVCVSSGLLDAEGAKALKAAGLDRLNHNLNTSESHYPNICTTHTYQDRLTTLQAGKEAGLGLCSGMILGMGESPEDVLHVARSLAEVGAVSIPINFLIPIPGAALQSPQTLTPDYCLRVLSLFRFLNPKAELRAAAGRELHLRDLQILALYPANSLFMQGYLNTQGDSAFQTLQMIQDAGFDIQSDQSLEALVSKFQELSTQTTKANPPSKADQVILKQLADLRPAKSVCAG